LAPFDWRLSSLGWWWPESLPIQLLTALGLAVLGFGWFRGRGRPIGLDLRRSRVLGLCLPILAAYFLLPLAFLEGPAAADNHFVETLKQRELRPGRYVELDRDRYDRGPEGPHVETFAGELLALEGLDIAGPALLSLRGQFASADRIVVQEYHVHPWGLRDLASYLGLALIAACWTRDRLRRWRLRQECDR
jgi:hypothetical protein